MAKSIYLDRALQPDEIMLAISLSERMPYWEEIIQHSSVTHVDFSCEWKFYGKAFGWSLVLKSKAKTLCYLTPADGYFHVSIIFNDKGRALAAETELPLQVIQDVDASKDNPKNIPYDFGVMGETDVEIAKSLISVRSKT